MVKKCDSSILLSFFFNTYHLSVLQQQQPSEAQNIALPQGGRIESTPEVTPAPVDVNGASTSASAPPKPKPRRIQLQARRAMPPRQMSRYASAPKPKPSTSAKRPRQPAAASSASQPRRTQPPRNLPTFRLPRPPAPSSSSSSSESSSPPPPVAAPQLPTADNADSTVPSHVLTAKALELLVNLVDAKQLLDNDKQAASSSSVTAHSPPVNVPDSTASDPMGVIMDRRVFESRFQDFEGRILSVKEELMEIVGRLQSLEKTTREQTELERKKRERVFRDGGVNCRPLVGDKSVQTETVVATDEDVIMGEPSVGATASTITAVRVFGEISVQTDEEQRPEEQTFTEQEPISRPATRPPSVSVSVPSMEIQTIVDSNSSSETDTDTITINTSSCMKEELSDPKTQIMSSNLSLLVNSMVSAKMLAVMENMAKNKSKEGTVSDSDPLQRRLFSPPVAASSVTDLLEEFKAMKEDALAREQRDKEELQALRELHSAEVDALRRRLYYLESQNRLPESSTSASASARYRSSSSNSAQGENSHRNHHHISAPVPKDRNDEGPSTSRQQHPHPNGHSKASPVEETSSSLSSPSRTAVTAKTPMPTPTPPERTYSFALPNRERDDEIPLPIKSQRKQHIMFPRPSFG
jgi:hypothetical protein